MRDEGHHPRRRQRQPAVSGDAGGLQAVAAGLRQADDLLSARRADAGRDPRDLDHFDARPTCRGSRRCWATAARSGSRCPMPSRRRPTALPKRSSSAASSSATIRSRSSLATISSTARGSAKSFARRPAQQRGATVFAYHVDDPERYGVVEFDPATGHRPIDRGEAGEPKSHWAVTGLYFYDNAVLDIAASLAPVAARRAGDHRRQPRLSRGRDACRWCGSAAASPGSTPAPTTACTMHRPTSARSRSGRASRSCAWRRLRSSWAISPPAQVVARADALGKTDYADLPAPPRGRGRTWLRSVRSAFDGLIEIRPRRFADDRGFFSETWNAAAWREAGIDASFVQDNHSLSRRRGHAARPAFPDCPRWRRPSWCG